MKEKHKGEVKQEKGDNETKESVVEDRRGRRGQLKGYIKRDGKLTCEITTSPSEARKVSKAKMKD